jgi:hypothetical protein
MKLSFFAVQTARVGRATGARHPKFSPEKVSLILEMLICFTHPKNTSPKTRFRPYRNDPADLRNRVFGEGPW